MEVTSRTVHVLAPRADFLRSRANVVQVRTRSDEVFDASDASIVEAVCIRGATPGHTLRRFAENTRVFRRLRWKHFPATKLAR